jgi:hypothetical protein
MANPVTYPQAATDIGLVTATCQFTVGAAGAVGSVQRSREMAATPVVHGTAGLYTFVFKEAWAHLAGMDVKVVDAAFSTAGARNVDIISNTLAVDGKIQVRFSKGTDYSVVDPASGDIVKAVFFLQKIKPSGAY